MTSAALADSSWLEGTLARYADSDLLALGLDARYNPERGWVTVARGTDWSGPDLAGGAGVAGERGCAPLYRHGCEQGRFPGGSRCGAAG